MKNMTLDELRNRLDQGPVALFDVRGDVEYQRGHIPTARSAPLGSLVFRVASLMKPDSLVVLYSSGSDGLSEEAAERLEGLGLRNVHCVETGLSGWADRGWTVTPSLHPKPGTDGPVENVRPIIVDRERAYGGAFRGEPTAVEAAGG